MDCGVSKVFGIGLLYCLSFELLVYVGHQYCISVLH